jgi:oligopeptide/dipeptide ABC transporter ATP-binding protein
MLEVEALRTSYFTPRGEVHAVNGVSFKVNPGQVVGLVGESGCGKSATVRSVIGLIRPPGRVLSGAVRLDGQDLLGLPASDLRRIRGQRVGFVSQSPFASLNPVLPLETQFRNVIRAHLRMPARDAHELALARLRSVGIAGPEAVLRGYAHQLSGGMAQRVVIAIAMLLNPRLLIADEPTTALDVTVQRQILDLIRGLVEAGQTSTLLVTHDLGVVSQYCDWVVVMYAGKVVEQGPVVDVMRDPRHPYTIALLESVPRPGRPLIGLSGRVPDLIDFPLGCPYQSRCPRAIDRCRVDAPDLQPVAATRDVSCHLVAVEQPSGARAALAQAQAG